ncbi:MAG: lipoate--protein ligase [Calditrichaceae bacterium]|nr:lipoate--protein ligase [Calditrichaceae bacterium]MBN2707644.1 lipoate--protein ligase [Calditrichaceae bacterium]RQV93186.1 MAG: lipoate--protein ligase [Calditrichota bacterium]
MLVINNRNYTSPALNLAVEEYAVRSLPAENDYLFIYRNESAVIIGKHQNHIREVNLRFCGENRIPVFRRISGGGAVYHDPGNLNFSIITRKTLQNFNQYRDFLQPVLNVIHKLGCAAELDERNNIVYRDYKLSGNAQFSSRERLLSHGTLLLNADLKKLSGSLKPVPEMEIECRAAQSIPASVTNLSAILKRPVKFDEMKRAILKETGVVNELIFSDGQWHAIKKLAHDKFSQTHWNFELSPPCKARKRNGKYIGECEVEKGKIKKLFIEEPKKDAQKIWDLTPVFLGCLYEYQALMKKCRETEATDYPFKILDFLM